MKKIILLLAFCLSVGNLFAQDANADKLREEGDAAMTAKNYPEGKAMSLRSQDKAADFTATVEAGLKANAQNANLEKLLYAYCMKKGQAAQKAGKTEEAEELFKDVLVVSNAKYKGNALYCLGVMFYNAGAKILADANPIATSDPDKYAAEKKKADAQMAKAKGYLEQAVALNAADANSKKILDAINAAAK